jgi:hypothetical protein
MLSERWRAVGEWGKGRADKGSNGQMVKWSKKAGSERAGGGGVVKGPMRPIARRPSCQGRRWQRVKWSSIQMVK